MTATGLGLDVRSVPWGSYEKNILQDQKGNIREKATSLLSLCLDDIMPAGASAALNFMGTAFANMTREAGQEAGQNWVLDGITKQLSQPWNPLVQ